MSRDINCSKKNSLFGVKLALLTCGIAGLQPKNCLSLQIFWEPGSQVPHEYTTLVDAWAVVYLGSCHTWAIVYLGNCLPGQLSTWAIVYLGHCHTWAVVIPGQLSTWAVVALGQLLYLDSCCLGSCPPGQLL